MAGPVILLVGNNPEITQKCRQILVEVGFSFQWAPDPQEGLRLLESGSIDILLFDLQIDESAPGEFLPLTRKRFPNLCSVVISTPTSFSKGIAALRSGADGLVLAPIEAGSGIVESIQWALEQRKQRLENLHLQSLRPMAGRLTASIAHEINNPLQAVQNCLHLAGRKELSPQERQKYLDLAQGEMQRLMLTTQRMLDFYRPVALERKPTDLNSLIKRVLLLLSQQLAETGIHVHTNFAANLPKVAAVADQIHQVILNLVINSIDAMPVGGDLFMETKSAPGSVQIIIEDTGPGLPSDERERIFEPFPSSKAHGIGIGLAVSYGIITAHAGTLEYLEPRKRGACFQIMLPVVDPSMINDLAEGE